MGVYDRSVWLRFRRHLGPGGRSGDWDPDSGKTHAVEAGHTLCGFLVGSIRDGWERDGYWRGDLLAYVSCGRCRRRLEREARQGVA